MSQTDLILESASALRGAKDRLATPPAVFVGLDGFIDEIVQVVDTRTDFQTFTPIRTIADYAVRLAKAAGKSTNVEFVLQQVKMGGNGPLMGDAMGRLGTNLSYVGALGYPSPHPVFDSLKAHGPVVSIANPGVTVAAEFEDGKIMHGRLESLAEITPENIVERMGGRGMFGKLLDGNAMVALVNWTMIPHMTSIWRAIIDQILSSGKKGPDFYFFDLCDPAKRTKEDLREAIQVIASFNRAHGTPILGLNEKESQEVCEAVGVDYDTEDVEGMIRRANALMAKTGIPEILIHPRDRAVAIGPDGVGIVYGPYCENPKLTTGAGDHFNGGYCFGRLVGLAPKHAVVVGKATSGFYVREGRGPSGNEVLDFMARWAAGRLDPWK